MSLHGLQADVGAAALVGVIEWPDRTIDARCRARDQDELHTGLNKVCDFDDGTEPTRWSRCRRVEHMRLLLDIDGNEANVAGVET
jgi:hypothetical protein